MLPELDAIRRRLRRHGILIMTVCAAAAPLIYLLMHETTGSRLGKATAGAIVVVVGFVYGLLHLRTPPWLQTPELISHIGPHPDKYGALQIIVGTDARFRRDYTFRPKGNEQAILEAAVAKLRISA